MRTSTSTPELTKPELLFSIITATYNCVGLFQRTADSIRNQRFRNFEWIVVDGASVDGTVERVYENKDIIDRFISEKDKGISDAWNKGISLSSGRYIVILNAGDTYDENFLEYISSEIDSGERIICCNARLRSENGDYIGTFRAQPKKLYRAMHLPHNWCAVPRIYYEEIGGYRQMNFAMDFDWFHRFFVKFGINGFMVIDRALGDYYLGGISDAKFVESFKANSEVLVSNGTPILVAFFWRMAYTLKHAFRYFSIKRLKRLRS